MANELRCAKVFFFLGILEMNPKNDWAVSKIFGNSTTERPGDKYFVDGRKKHYTHKYEHDEISQRIEAYKPTIIIILPICPCTTPTISAF